MRHAPLCLLALALILGGCGGYHLGPTNGQTVGEKSVEITPFLDHTPELGLANEVTAALRKYVQRDGTYRLATHKDGDLIVSGVVTTYHRRAMSLLSSDLRTVTDYQLTITAQVTVRERATGRVVWERPIKGQTVLRVGSDFDSSERQSAPLLAQDLAQKVHFQLVDESW